MFDIGPEKLLLVLAAVFIFLGPKELPAAARTIGDGLRKLRALQDTLRTELGSALDLSTQQPPTPQLPPQADGSPQDDRVHERFGAGPSSFT